MALQQRPPEPFHRVYSPPEPPATVRRSRVVTLLLATAALTGAATAVLVLVPWDSPRRTADSPTGSRPGGPVPGSSATTPQTSTPTEPATNSAPVAQVFSKLPPPCRSVSDATVGRLVPGAKTTESSNTTFSSCAYSSSGQAFRWLRVDNRLYTASSSAKPVEDARRLFGVQWSLAGRATEERTVSLERLPGLGDEAYRWFKVDKQQPTAIGVVAVRLRNVVITVSYSEQAVRNNKLGPQEQRCLSQATAVAREVLGQLG